MDHRETLGDGTMLGERNVVHYRLTEGDPLSAKVDCEVEVELGRGDWGPLRVVAAGEMTQHGGRVPRHHAARLLRGRRARARARLDPHDPAGRRVNTIPWSWYEDPAVARRERDRIFMRSWQYAGRTAELTAPGSFVATQVGGLPVVLTRDRDDTLRAFANVCRHRGAIVAQRRGGARDAPVPLPRLDLRPRRLPARRTAHPRRPGLRDRRARARADGDRDVGPVRVRQPGRGGGAARAGARRAARRRRRARARRRRARLPPPRRVRDPRELEDRARELPRVLPLPAQPPGARLADRRPAADARGGRAARQPVQPGPPGPRAAGAARSRAASSTCSSRASRSTPSPGRRTSRSGRSGRSRPTAAAATSTTSSRRTSPRRGSRSSSPSTTRSGRRTPRSSRAPRPARGAGSCPRGGCSRTTSS